MLFKLHWGGRGKKGEEWRKIVEGDGDDEGFQPKLERMWAEQDYLHPRVKRRLLPVQLRRQRARRLRPRGPRTSEIERLVFPRQPKHDRICLADFYKPIDSGERDVVALQGVTVGPEVTELLAQLEKDGEFSEQLFTHGLAVQSAEGLAEWLHSARRARRSASTPTRAGATPGATRPARTSPSTRRCGSCWSWTTIGMYLSDGFAVMPEQSTVAIVAHHPQSVYFGMKSGFIPEEKAPDELIAGTERGGELPPDDDPENDAGAVEAEGEGRAADEVPA